MTDQPPPAYAFRCFFASGIAGSFSVVCFALMFSFPDQWWMRVAAVIGALCAVVGVAVTVVCLKVDENRRELRALSDRQAALDERVRLAIEEQTSDLSAVVAELQAFRSQVGDYMKANERRQAPPAPRRRRHRRSGAAYAADFVDGAIDEERRRNRPDLKLITPKPATRADEQKRGGSPNR